MSPWKDKHCRQTLDFYALYDYCPNDNKYYWNQRYSETGLSAHSSLRVYGLRVSQQNYQEVIGTFQKTPHRSRDTSWLWKAIRPVHTYKVNDQSANFPPT